ncbi:MAG: PH domain-containing protein [bacterium]
MNIEELIHQKPNEKVIFYLRRHPIVFIGGMLFIVAMMLVPIGAWALIEYNWPELLTGELSRPSLVLLGSAYYLWSWMFLFAHFVDYYLDAWVITSDRILNIEQEGLFNRTVSELDLSNVQDVTSEVRGILAFFFGYGDVYIQTAAERERFIFEQVYGPDEIRKRLLILVAEDRKRQNSETA